MKAIILAYHADKLTITELEELIDRLQQQEQDGAPVSYDLHHLTNYLKQREEAQ